MGICLLTGMERSHNCNIMPHSREKNGIKVDCFIERLLLNSCLCLFLVLVCTLHLVWSFSGLINKEAELQNFPTLAGINGDEIQILSMLSGSNLRLYIKIASYSSHQWALTLGTRLQINQMHILQGVKSQHLPLGCLDLLLLHLTVG